jgi:putative ABC transport system substrate-binding protein
MTMRRREFVSGAALLAVSPAAAKTSTEPRRLAIFSPFQPATDMREQSSNRYYRAIFAELRRLGHIEGQNLTVERFGKEQSTASLAAAAAEVVRRNPDVMLAIGFPGFAQLKAETTTIPIVAFTGDPIAAGLIPSLAHPGGNITGVSTGPPELWGKRIELLREIFPAISKLAILGPVHSSRCLALQSAPAALQHGFLSSPRSTIRRRARRCIIRRSPQPLAKAPMPSWSPAPQTRWRTGS